MNSRPVPSEEVAVPPFRCPPAQSASQQFPQCAPQPASVQQENVLPESAREPELDWSQILNDGQSSSHREPVDPIVSEPPVVPPSQTPAESFLPVGTHNRALVNRGQGKPCYVRVTPWPNVDVVPLPPQQVLERANAIVPTGLATPIVSPALEVDPSAPNLELPISYSTNAVEQRPIPFAQADGAATSDAQADFGTTIDMQVRSSYSPSLPNLQYAPCSRADFIPPAIPGDGNEGAISVPSAENLGVEAREIRRTVVAPLQNPLVAPGNSTDEQFIPSAPSSQPLETNNAPLNRASDSDGASQTGHSSLSDVRRESYVRQQAAVPSKQHTSALHRRFLAAAARRGFVARRNANSEETSTVETETSRVVSLIPNEVDVVPVKLMPAKGEGRTRSPALRLSNQPSATDENRRASKGKNQRAFVSDADPENYSSSDRDSKPRGEKQHRFKRNERPYGEHWEGERGRYQRRNSSNRRYRYSDGEEEDEEVLEGYRDSSHPRPRSRGSTRSAYEERDEYDAYRYPNYGAKGNRMVRSLSRMSDHDDWHSEDYGRSYKTRYRPKSAQPEFWEGRNDSDEGDYYEDERRYQRHNRKVHGQETVLSDPRMRTLWQIPAWRHYLNEHKRQCGYFPTYEQLQYYTLAQQQPAMVSNVSQAAAAHAAPMGQFIRPTSGISFPGAPLTPGFPAANAPAQALQPKLPAEPYLHTRPHSTCCFGSGGHLITYGQPKGVKGICTSVEIRNLRSYLLGDKLQADIALIEVFPGPLDAEKTAKDVVLHYCTKRLEQLKKSYEHRDHHNMLLLFQFFVLMVRQNGIVSGKDLAHLLLETCDDGIDYGERNMFEEEVQADVVSDSDSDFVIPLRVETNGNGRSVASKGVQTTDVAEQEFTRLLLRGYIKEAMDWAIKTKLWGHALFLAMKMNKHMHTTVMTRFANSVPVDSPLQTLYQMLSGGVPYASTRLPDKSWIEWRPHLAMILANLTSQDEEMRQRELYGVLTMGHTLFNCGQIFGSQFCYICCHLLANWNIFESGQGQQAPLITLVGADSPERDNFAIQNYILTEILEYTIGLHWLHGRNCFFWILPFQHCKLQFTTRMAELGFREEAISYCKVLNKALQYQSALGSIPSLSFCLSLYELSLKYHRFDPDSEMPMGSTDIPEWVRSLGLFCEQLKSSSGRLEPTLAKAEVASPENAANMQTTVSTRSDVSSVISANVNASFEGEKLVVQPQTADYGYPTIGIRTDAPAGYQHAVQTSSTATTQQSFLEQRRRSSDDSRRSESSGIVHTVQTIVSTETHSQIQERFPGGGSEAQSYVQPSLLTEATPIVHEALGSQYTSLGGEVSQQRRSEGLLYASGAASSTLQPSSGTAETEINKKTPISRKEQQQSWIGKTMGGFIHRLIPKGPNEMILPDDSQKTIVWDKEKERWVDVTATDGDSAEHIAPPPSAGGAMPSPADHSESATPYSATPVYAGVKTKRYVDVVKSADQMDASGSSILPPHPFAASEGASVPQTYWMPQNNPSEVEVVSPFTEAAPQEDAQQSMGVPFMDPSRYASG